MWETELSKQLEEEFRAKHPGLPPERDYERTADTFVPAADCEKTDYDYRWSVRYEPFPKPDRYYLVDHAFNAPRILMSSPFYSSDEASVEASLRNLDDCEAKLESTVWKIRELQEKIMDLRKQAEEAKEKGAGLSLDAEQKTQALSLSVEMLTRGAKDIEAKIESLKSAIEEKLKLWAEKLELETAGEKEANK